MAYPILYKVLSGNKVLEVVVCTGEGEFEVHRRGYDGVEVTTQDDFENPNIFDNPEIAEGHLSRPSFYDEEGDIEVIDGASTAQIEDAKKRMLNFINSLKKK